MVWEADDEARAVQSDISESYKEHRELPTAQAKVPYLVMFHTDAILEWHDKSASPTQVTERSYDKMCRIHWEVHVHSYAI